MKNQPEIKGFITAAGLGKRLGALTKRTNKSLLMVDKKPLIFHSIEKMRETGIKDIIIAGGYQIGSLRKQVGNMALVVLNPFYSVSGILGSFWAARDHLRGSPFLFSTSDHFFSRSVLEDCLKTTADICIVVQRKGHYTKEDSKVITRSGRIISLGKDIPVERANGEFGGMAYFSKRGSVLFFEALENMLEKGLLMGYVADVLTKVENEHGAHISYSECYDGSRIEIDSVRDLINARKIAKGI